MNNIQTLGNTIVQNVNLASASLVNFANIAGTLDMLNSCVSSLVAAQNAFNSRT